MKKIKLICIPYAGGSAQVYQKWRGYLNELIEINPIELAGRGKRFSEPVYKDIDEAINDIFKIVRTLICNSEYAIFGHSMGSELAYELLHRIKERGFHNPVHAFFSGRHPPYVQKEKPDLHDAPIDVFLSEIQKNGGTPKELVDNDEFLNVFIPILRADYKILETRGLVSSYSKFDFDISVFSGKLDDEIEYADLEAWRNCTNGKCGIYQFSGGHFFINQNISEVIDIINDTLCRNW